MARTCCISILGIILLKLGLRADQTRVSVTLAVAAAVPPGVVATNALVMTGVSSATATVNGTPFALKYPYTFSFTSVSGGSANTVAVSTCNFDGSTGIYNFYIQSVSASGSRSTGSILSRRR